MPECKSVQEMYGVILSSENRAVLKDYLGGPEGLGGDTMLLLAKDGTLGASIKIATAIHA